VDENTKQNLFAMNIRGVGEQISHQLMDAILKNDLKWGDRLVEQELQQVFGVSRSPIREAFRELEKRGLVEIIPRKGTFVKRISREDIEDTFPVRAVLERLAANLTVDRMTAKDIEEMEQALDAMRKAAANNDTKAYWNWHVEFHEIFINACGNQVLIGILRTLRLHALWFRYSYLRFKEELQSSLTVHERILELFKAGEKRKPELLDLMQSHVEAGMDRFLEYLESETRKA